MRRLIAVLIAAGRRFSDDGGAFFAQALAFNAILAIFPIGLLALSVFAFIYGHQGGESEFLSLIKTLAPAVQDVLVQNLQQAVDLRSLSGVIAVILLVWSGKNLFMGLTYSLDRALKVPQSRPFFADIIAAIIIIPVIFIILLIATVVPIALSVIASSSGFHGPHILASIASYAAGAALVFVICAVLYVALPNQRLPWTFGVPGAIVAAIGWEIAQIAFAIYTTHVNFLYVYGALSALAVLLLWFYYHAVIFLYGAHVSAQWLAHGPETPAQPARLEQQRTA